MSAGESLPARPRPLARTRPRIPRQPWGGGVPSGLDLRLAQSNASGVGRPGHKSTSGCSVGPAPWRQQGCPHARPAQHPRKCLEGAGEKGCKNRGKGKPRQRGEKSLNTGNIHTGAGKGGAAQSLRWSPPFKNQQTTDRFPASQAPSFTPLRVRRQGWGAGGRARSGNNVLRAPRS